MTDALDYLDYFLPREVIGPVILIFSLENVISIIFEATISSQQAVYFWGIIFLVTSFLTAVWGVLDDDIEDLD